jgi:hypothetical protein
MLFSKEKGKQTLDLKGNLILSKNDNLVEATSKSAAPAYTSKNPHYIMLGKLGRRSKFLASIIAIKFIWGK